MKESVHKNYDELPLFLSAKDVSNLLGVSLSTAYELMHEDDFPSLRVGNRYVIPKEDFQKWVKENMKGGWN